MIRSRWKRYRNRAQRKEPVALSSPHRASDRLSTQASVEVGRYRTEMGGKQNPPIPSRTEHRLAPPSCRRKKDKPGVGSITHTGSPEWGSHDLNEDLRDRFCSASKFIWVLFLDSICK